MSRSLQVLVTAVVTGGPVTGSAGLAFYRRGAVAALSVAATTRVAGRSDAAAVTLKITRRRLSRRVLGSL